MTKLVIEEWLVSPLGILSGDRAALIVQKRRRKERHAAVEVQANLLFPVGSRLSYFWACDGMSYTGTIVALNVEAKVLSLSTASFLPSDHVLCTHRDDTQLCGLTRMLVRIVCSSTGFCSTIWHDMRPCMTAWGNLARLSQQRRVIL